MLFAKKGQRAVLRLVELPAAGDFLRAPQEKKEDRSRAKGKGESVGGHILILMDM